MIKRELLETITAEEWETIVALRAGEARVVAVPVPVADSATADLVIGKMYVVVHRSGLQRRARLSVMRLLDITPSDLIFDARPVAGTQTMPRDWIIKVEPTAETTPSLNQMFT